MKPGFGVIDTHCHLQAKYMDAGVPLALEKAREAGVRAMVTIGSSDSLEVCDEAIALAEANEDVWAAVGYHPHEAQFADEAAFEGVLERARHPRVVAIGETGLDYFYDRSPREQQQEAFHRFLQIAREVKKPVVIHARGADKECIEVFESERVQDIGGVVHCFTSGWELARDALDRGFYLGFTGIVSFKKAEEVREVLRKTPLDRIVVETDSPFLAPVPYRGKPNHPAWVVDVARAVAEALDLPLDQVVEQTTQNAQALYRCEF